MKLLSFLLKTEVQRRSKSKRKEIAQEQFHDCSYLNSGGVCLEVHCKYNVQ